MADPHAAAPTPSPAPAPSGGGVAKAADALTSLVSWGVLARYLPQLMALSSQLRAFVARQGVEAERWVVRAFNRFVGPWGWLISALLAAAAYGSRSVLDALHDWQGAPLEVTAYIQLVAGVKAVTIIAAFSAVLQFVNWMVSPSDVPPSVTPATTPSPRTWRDKVGSACITTFLIGNIVTGVAVFVLGMLYIRYAAVAGQHASIYTDFFKDFVEIAGRAHFPRCVLVLGGLLMFLGTLPAYLILKFMAWGLSAAIYLVEGGAGTFMGIAAPPLVAGLGAEDFKSIVAKAHDAIDEKKLNDAINGSVKNFWMLLVWVGIATFVHVHPKAIGWGILSALLTVFGDFYATQRGNEDEVKKRQKQFGLWVLTIVTLEIIWVGIELFCPELVPWAADTIRAALAFPGEAACVAQGIFVRTRTYSTFLTVIVAIALLAACVMIVYKVWHGGPKDWKELVKKVALMLVCFVLVGAGVWLVGFVLMGETSTELSRLGCPVDGTKTVVAAPAAAPASTAKPAPGKTGATPTSSGSPAPADSSHAAYLALCKQRGIKCQ